MAYAATIENAKRDFDRICANIKTTTVASRLGSAAGPVSASGVISYLEYLIDERNRMVAIAAIPGIADAYPDVAAEAGAVMSATLAGLRTQQAALEATID